MGTNKYGVILDAGSSGTRVHIYRWNSKDAAETPSFENQKRLPRLETKKKWTMKVHPGVSAFANRPASIGDEHLKQLFAHALSYVPAAEVDSTPLFIMATAGMRLLPQIQRANLLNEICAYTQATTNFYLPDCDFHVQVIDGVTEGLYGWIAANYLLGGFDTPEKHDHGKGHHTYGFLDMGGASAQIAFAPNQTEAEKHANDLKLLRLRTLDGVASEYRVFVATWLGFGVNQARIRYLEALQDAAGFDVKELPDPCLPLGLIVTLNGDLISLQELSSLSVPYLRGVGHFDECLRKTFPLLEKDALCKDSPCMLHGQHVPAIDFDVNHFIGISEYWHTTHGVFEMSHEDKSYDFNTYQQRVEAFCSRDWQSIQDDVTVVKWGKKVDTKAAIETCFKASWLINMLHDGIGIPRVGLESAPNGFNGTVEVVNNAKEKGFLDPFQAVDKIDGIEVSWTLGKMVIYACGQIEPQDQSLPVGFGSNEYKGVPTNFQDGGPYNLSPYHGTTGGTSTIHFSGTFSSTTFSLMGAFLGLVLLICLLGSKERRTRLSQRFNTFLKRYNQPPRPRKGFRGMLTRMFSSHPMGNYERVLEDGQISANFELESTGTEEYDFLEGGGGSRAARTSGLATPNVNLVKYADNSYFEGVPPARGNGISNISVHSAMDRSGLVVRTESRERISGILGGGRTKSRSGSPTRKTLSTRSTGNEA